MKRYIRLLGVLLILFSSCSDFLEEKSQDLIIPKSVKDYREFLFGEAYTYLPGHHDGRCERKYQG